MTNNPIIKVEEGKYLIKITALQKDSEEASAMKDYLSPMAIVTNQADQLSLTVVLEDHKITKGFQIENSQGEPLFATDSKVNKEGNKRFELFKLDQLSTYIHAQVQYEIEHEGRVINGDEPLRLFFDKASLVSLDDQEWD